MAKVQSMIEELVLWSKDLGTTLHHAVQVYEDPITGLSFRAVKDIPSGTKLVNCSYKATLSYLNAVDAPGFARHSSIPFPKAFLNVLGLENPNVVGSFFLMQQYIQREQSFWFPYIRLLPQPDNPSSVPALWPEEDQRWLDGTNAEPAIKKRMAMWEDEWKKGIALLRGFQNQEQYTYNLYKWAASIFGSRSFRSSLTIPEVLVLDYLDHVRNDNFSILLPVMDIGNHNGINNVDWTPDPSSGVFLLSNRGPIRHNDQIFNYYGNKSNSELLVGYGFTLPTTLDLDRDTANLKLKPPVDALALRRSQQCHGSLSEADEGFMFSVHKRIGRDDQRLEDFAPFSDGLVDLVLCMVANKRERKYLSSHPEYCPESDPTVFESSLARAVLMTLQTLNAKMASEYGRIAASAASHRTPQNENQRLALDYARRQLSTLLTARSALANRLSSVLSFSTFSASASNFEFENFAFMHGRVEVLSLEHAFDWLRIYYADIYTAVVEMISEDQDEPLPLDWNILVEDWDHTYWIVWIFIVWMLWARDGEAFRRRHPSLRSWLIDINRAYDDEISAPGNELLYADPSEIPTVDLMVQSISKLLPFSATDMQKWLQSQNQVGPVTVMTRLRNFASYVANEETFAINDPSFAKNPNRSIDPSGGMVQQKALCITKRDESHLQESQESWSMCISQSPGARNSPNV